MHTVGSAGAPPAPGAAAGADVARQQGRDRWRLVVPVVLAALLLPLVVGVVRAVLDDPTAPSGDVALIELRVRDVGSKTPLLGSYGRYGFNHPGPLLFYVQALPYRLLGARFAGLEVGTLALGALAVAAIAWVTLRRGGPLLLLWAGLLVAVLVHAVGPAWLANPWEPHGLLLPCAALVVLAFDAAAGRWWTLPIVAGVASLLGQAQATLLPFAVALGAVATAGVAARVVRRPDDRSGALRALAVAAVLTGLLWAPTVVEQLTREPGNLIAMARSRNRPEPVLGLVDGFRLVAIQLGLRGPWLGWSTPLDGFGLTVDPGGAPMVPAGAVALLLALVVAARRRLQAGVLAAASALAALVAALSSSRLLGPVFIWIPQWTRVLGFACWLAVGWVAASALPAAVRHRLRAPVAAVLLVGAVGLSLVNLVEAASYDRPDDPIGRVVRSLTREAAPVITALEDPVLASTTAEPAVVFGSAVGLESLVLTLERSGAETVVAPELADHFGPERAHPERATAELRLTLESEPVPEGFRIVARADPLTPAQRKERGRLLESIGLDEDAVTEDVQRELDRDPSIRPVFERLAAHTDLPPFVLLLADRRP